jgi:hypothetical protein
MELRTTAGQLAVAAGPSLSNSDGWLKTYNINTGGELAIIGSVGGGQYGSLFLKNQADPASLQKGASIYYSLSGWHIAAGTLSGNQEGVFLSYQGSNPNEKRIVVDGNGATGYVFLVDAEGDFWGNSMKLNGAGATYDNVVNGITIAATDWTNATDRLVTESAVQGWVTAQDYVKRDGSTPMTGDWAFGGVDLTGVDDLTVNDDATIGGDLIVNGLAQLNGTLKTAGAIYAHAISVNTTGGVYNVLATDYIIIVTDAAGGAPPPYDISLPDPSVEEGRIIQIRNIDTDNVDVISQGGATIYWSGADSWIPSNEGAAFIAHSGAWYQITEPN